MTTATLATALANCASGLCALDAGAALVISHGTFLLRGDFTSRFVEHGTSGGVPMAAIDREAAISAPQLRPAPLLRRRAPHLASRSEPRCGHPGRPAGHRHRP